MSLDSFHTRVAPKLHQGCIKVAENIRRRIAERTVNTSTGASFNFTVSIGVFEYDGHPDYQRFLDSVDKALYVAKNNGRNNIYMG